MDTELTLVSHHLCPYVQRAAIALAEKQVPFKRLYINLSAKPESFLKVSPLGKTPVLLIADRAIFESAAIVEYLEETQPNPIHPTDPLARAEHRGWIEFASAALNDIAGFYNAPDPKTLGAKAESLKAKFAQVEIRLERGPWFANSDFSLVDAALGPVFRYFEVIDPIAKFGFFKGLDKTSRWRDALAQRPSVRDAVSADYADRLRSFLFDRRSHLSTLLSNEQAA